MKNYLHSAIDTIYRKDDELIIIGLTGRTGSGCSTVAKILCSEKGEIRHSLTDSTSSMSNDARKRRIIAHHFNLTWKKFQLIQVRWVITLLLVEQEIGAVLEKVQLWLKDEPVNLAALQEKLVELKRQSEDCVNGGVAEQQIEFFTISLPRLCEEIRKVLGGELSLSSTKKLVKIFACQDLPWIVI